jgi:hypothetical protein
MKAKLGTIGTVLFLCVAGFAILFLPRLVLAALGAAFPLPTALGALALLVGFIVVARRRNREAVRRIKAWASAGGWISVPAGRSWPWESLLRDPDTVTVERAWQSMVDGLLITVGELRWSDNALSGAVEGWAGKGVFVEVGLPVATEPMGMRRPNRTIGTSHRLDRPALMDAFENGEIPPFAALDRSLFTFEASQAERLAPESLDSLLERTRRIVRLLDLGPDGSR